MGLTKFPYIIIFLGNSVSNQINTVEKNISNFFSYRQEELNSFKEVIWYFVPNFKASFNKELKGLHVPNPALKVIKEEKLPF